MSENTKNTLSSQDVISLFVKCNTYVRNAKRRSSRNMESISYLVDMPMSQSECIRIGIAMEKILVDVMNGLMYENLTQQLVTIKTDLGRRQKQTDLLFKCGTTLYYFELKCNLNLDTEKSQATIHKLLQIVKSLTTKYSQYKIVWGLVGLRYYSSSIIQQNLLNKYKPIVSNLYGMNEFLDKIMSDVTPYDDTTYKQLINDVATQMFANST